MRRLSSIKNKFTLQIVDDIKREIASSVGQAVRQVVLYGSYARNEQTGDSDVDIVVFYDGSVDSRSSIRRKLTEIQVDLSLKYDVVLSILLKDYDNFLDRRKMLPFYSNIYNEGVAIYG